MFSNDFFNIMPGIFRRQKQIGPGCWLRNKWLKRGLKPAGLSINSRNRGGNGCGGSLITQFQLRLREGATRRRAEGFERLHVPEKLQFYNVARGSTAEVRSLLYVIEDNFPQSASEAVALRDEVVSVGKLVSGLIRSTEKRKRSIRRNS
jgi:hypothetical protein